MAGTVEAAALTEQHRQAQNNLRSSALTDFLALWPIWQGDVASFVTLINATRPLVDVYRRMSSTLSSAYYEAHRSAEDVEGSSTVRLAPQVAVDQLARSMYSTGLNSAGTALRAGRPAAQARRDALTRVSGAVTRHVLNGGRETIIESVQADEKALGWVRITDGEPCAFCAILAGRGAVYKTETTADFQAHDHCGCQASPLYKGFRLPDSTGEYKKLYNKAIRDARAAGELDRGTSNDLLNAFRRALDAKRVPAAD